MTTLRNDVLVWIDLEMTGLDPDTCGIVELAMILTDHQLNEIGKPLELVIWQPEPVLALMSPFVRDMHQKSGLLEKIGQSQIDIPDAEQQVLQMVSQAATMGTARLAGNSIWQDRRFLNRYMPGLLAYLHYRLVDVSSVKELGQWWYKSRYDKPTKGKHTAMCDIRQSIAELKFLRENVFAKQG